MWEREDGLERGPNQGSPPQLVGGRGQLRSALEVKRQDRDVRTRLHIQPGKTDLTLKGPFIEDLVTVWAYG